MPGMFVIGKDNRLVGLTEQPYDSEDLLQTLLATYPDILAGEEMAPNAPRQWLLVSRETGVPDVAGGAPRWSVDHVFLDQDGIPTLVEVKRSSDSRIRREVVGQMLDYAANALVYLPVETIRAAFEARCDADGQEPWAVLAAAFGGTLDDEQYWGRVKTNLEAGHIRLVFVADVIPSELRRVIEYLNGQMNPTEVYGVEIKQYVGEELRTLVPRLVGRTADAGRAKSTGTSSRGETWTLERFEEVLLQRAGPDGVRRTRKLLEWAKSRGLRIWWGAGTRYGGFIPVYDSPDGESYQFFEMWTYGSLEVHFQWLATKAPFSDESMRRQLRDRLQAAGANIPIDAIDRRPPVSLLSLPNDDAVDEIIAAFDWALQAVKMRGAATPGPEEQEDS